MTFNDDSMKNCRKAQSKCQWLSDCCCLPIDSVWVSLYLLSDKIGDGIGLRLRNLCVALFCRRGQVITDMTNLFTYGTLKRGHGRSALLDG